MPAIGRNIPALGAANLPSTVGRQGLPLLVTLLIVFWLTAFSFQHGFGAAYTLQGVTPPAYGRGYVDGMFYLMAIVGVLAHLSEAIRLAGRMWLYLAFVAFVATTAAWSAYPSWVAISVGHFVGIWLIAAATAALWSESRPRLYAAIYWAMIVYLLASVAVILADPAIGVRPIPDASGRFANRWQGVASHPNDFAYSIILLIWAALAIRTTSGNRVLRRVSYVAVPLALAIAAVGARSMTATIASLGMIVAHFLLPKAGAKAGSARQKFVLLSLLGLGFVAAAIAAYTLVGMDGGGAHGALKLGGRDLTTVSGRTQLWTVAWSAFAEKPWGGWSFDSLATFFDAVGAPNFPYNQFHNGWLDLMVRGGLIGLSLGLAMMIRFIRVMIRLWPIDPVSARISGLFFIAVMLENLSEAQLGVTGNPLWAMLVVLWAMNEVQVMRAPGAAHPVSARPA